MSWINSNATYKQNSKNDLSFYHGFSKTPVEPTSSGTAATTLANASTKGGHTVIGTEVWAEEIPWFGLVASRAAAVTRLSGLTKLNDLVKVDGEGGKVYKYIGTDDATFTEAQWSSFWQEVTLTNGMTLNNRHNQPVLRYYLNQPMQTLTTTNNASIDSKGFATRLFVNESDHTGQTSGGSVVSQFAAGTDNIKNGIPSVELNPKLYLGTTEKIAGTHYYDYNVSGTILWNVNVASSSPKISCFRYIGKTVTGQLATIDSAVTTHSNEISEIKEKLGLGDTGTEGTPTLGGRVTALEDAVETLNGDDTTVGSVAKTVKDAIDGLGDVAVKSDITITDIKVKQGSGEAKSLTITDKSVTIEIPEVLAAVVAEDGVVTTDGFTKTADVTNLAKAAINAAIKSTDGAIADAIDDAISDATLTSGDNAIQSATGDTAIKLVTAEQVKEYVTENAQVTVTVGETDVTSTGFEFAGYAGTDVSVAAEMDSNGKVTYSATLSKATVDTATGAITDGDLAVSATDAKTIADKAIKTALADTTEGSLGDKIGDVESLANQAKTTADSAVQSITRAAGSSELITVTDGTNATISLSTEVATKTDAANAASEAITSSLTDTTTAGSIGKAIDDAKKAAIDNAKVTITQGTGITVTPNGTASTSFTVAVDGTIATKGEVSALQGTEITQQSVSGAGITVTLDGTVGAPTLTGSVTTATYTAATETVAGSWTNDTNVAKASDVKNAISDVLAAAKKYSDGLHTTSLDYVVLGDSESLPTASANTLGKIYLVAKDNVPAEDGSALSGDYVEYMTRKIDDGDSATYTWEKIGTTSADLSNYITKKDIAAVTTTITAAQTSADKKLASITNGGDSRVIVGEATADGDEKSISIKLADTVAIKSDITSAIDAIDVGVKSVKAADNSALVGTSVTTTDGAVTIKTDGVVENAVIPTNTVRVENGLCYDGSGAVIAPIATEKIKSISSIPATLTTWIGDMPIWTGGDLRAATNLTTFLADMSSVSTTTSIGGNLDADSVESILYTIGEVSSDTPLILALGVSSDGSKAIADFMGEDTELTSYSYKGWTINVTKPNA